ncbi:hypothetical protein [Burkholderia ambifaria]|uniref:hypothetical protein n=1 Tax=Burkholderia ambifaria TaxID=152480 RepID=UPI001ABA4007|nr:hypothetical protein [Burkholderia ambifaria]
MATGSHNGGLIGAVAVQKDAACGRQDGSARVGQARQYLRRGEVLRRDLAGHGALLDACVRKHDAVFVAAPVPFGMPLHDGEQDAATKSCAGTGSNHAAARDPSSATSCFRIFVNRIARS